MDIRKGDHVRVNLAPFIGAAAPADQWIDCEVLEVDGAEIEVATLEPYRRVEMRVEASWIKLPRRTQAAAAV